MSKEPCVRRGLDAPAKQSEGEMAHCKVYGFSTVSCTKMAIPVELQFGMLSSVGPGSMY